MSATHGADFGIGMPSIGELWYMVHNSNHVAENARNLRRILRQLNIWPFDMNEAEEFGRIRVELERRGRPIPGIDVQIAAIARVNEMTVLSADRHFSFIPNVSVEDWTTA